MADPDSGKILISVEQATAWAESCLHMNHLGTLVQRELTDPKYERARDLSERARVRAWKMFNELLAVGAEKPKGYREPDPSP